MLNCGKKLTNIFETGLRKCEVVVQNSLSEKQYLKINNSPTTFFFSYVNLDTVQIWGQSTKFPLSCNSAFCCLSSVRLLALSTICLFGCRAFVSLGVSLLFALVFLNIALLFIQLLLFVQGTPVSYLNSYSARNAGESDIRGSTGLISLVLRPIHMEDSLSYLDNLLVLRYSFHTFLVISGLLFGYC